MSLKIRLTLLSALWLLCILLLFNLLIYYFFIKVTTQSEIQLLLNKASSILNEDFTRSPKTWHDQKQLEEFLLFNEMIRIIDTHGTVINQVASNEDLLSIPVKLNSATQVIQSDTGRSIVVQLPIFQLNSQVQLGVLEIGKKLSSMEYHLDILMSILFFTTAGAIFLAIAGGYFYTRVLFKPIHHLAHTMQKIEKSGSFEQLQLNPSPHSDELDTLVQTFNKMIRKLEENLSREKQFVADASHELRTPLTIIESYANLLKRWASNDPVVREEAIEAIHSEAIRLRGLTDALLSLRTEDEHALRLERFSVLELIQKTAATFQQTYDRGVVTESFAVDVQMVGDPEKIKQLMIILLDNALKYSKKDIRILIEEKNNYIHIKVIDKGIGIREEHIQQLFKRFYRVDVARNRKTGGFGLGLTIAEKIVKQHRGSIEVKSRWGEGTVIHLMFPKEWETGKDPSVLPR